MVNFAERLVKARELSGKTPEQVSRLAGLNLPSYYDCEMGEDLRTVISLHELKGICDAVGIKSWELFSDIPVPEVDALSYKELSRLIRQHLEENHLGVADFEDIIGFEVSKALEEPDLIGEWSVEWLQWLCARLAVDWLRALP